MSRDCATSADLWLNGPEETFRVVRARPGAWCLCGELDVAAVPVLRGLLPTMEGDVELDCSRLTFIDARGLRCLVAVHRHCERRGAKLVIVNPARCVLRLVELTELGAGWRGRPMVRLDERT